MEQALNFLVDPTSWTLVSAVLALAAVSSSSFDADAEGSDGADD